MCPKCKKYLIVGGVIAGIVGVAYLVHKASNISAKGVGESVGGAVVDGAVGVIGGINDGLGIPRTSDVVRWWNGLWSNDSFGKDHPVDTGYKNY